MSILTIDSCKPSKSGKSLSIGSGGKWYSAKLDSGLDQHVGEQIDVKIATSEYNGTSMMWLNEWKLVGGAVSHAPASQPALASINNIMPLMPFVSNTVAHALLAGKIEQPGDIAKWARAAYAAALGLEQDPNADFRDAL